MTKKRVVFLGEKPLGLRCLELLAKLPEADVVGVCTRTRGNVWWGRHEVAEHCQRTGIPLIPRERIPDLQPDLLISVLYPFVIEAPIFDGVRGAAVNLHEAPLPRWRGCNGYSHAILAGDAEYGVTLHEMVAALDAGPLIHVRRFPIRPNETAKELYERTTEESFALAKEWFPRVLGGDYAARAPPADEESFVNARNSLEPHKPVGLDDPIDTVFQKARAMDFVPWEPAHLDVAGERYYVFIADSLGRADGREPAEVSAKSIASLSDLPWGTFRDCLVEGLPRPLAVCNASLYRERFPLFGR